MPVTPVHPVGSHPHHFVEAQSPHPRVALAEDLPGTIHLHLTHQVNREVLELLGKVLTAPRPRWGHTVHLAVIATASSRKGTNDYALLVEGVDVPPLHRLAMVEAGHRGPGTSTFLRPQVRHFLHFLQEGRGACFKPRLHHKS